MHNRWTTTLAGALIVASAWACSDSTSPGTGNTAFNQAAAADLAPSAGEDMSADFNFYVNASATSGLNLNVIPNGSGAATPRSAFVSASCTYNSTTTYFTCPTVTWFFHTYASQYQLLDGSGVAQSAYSASTTGSVHFVSSDTSALAFSLGQLAFGDTSSRHHDVTVGGLLGDPDTMHVWNGTGTGHIRSQRTGPNVSKVYDYTFSDTTTAVRVGQPRSNNAYPLSGTIVKRYTVTRQRDGVDSTAKTTTIRASVTFNGTAIVPLTVGSVTYSLNLDTHRVTQQ